MSVGLLGSLALGTLGSSISLNVDSGEFNISHKQSTLIKSRPSNVIYFTYKDWQKGKSWRLIFDIPATEAEINKIDDVTDHRMLFAPVHWYEILIRSVEKPGSDQEYQECRASWREGGYLFDYDKVNDGTLKIALKYYNYLNDLKNRLLTSCYSHGTMEGFRFESW